MTDDGQITDVQCQLVSDAESKYNYGEPFPCRFLKDRVALWSQKYEHVGVIDIKHGDTLRRLRDVASSLRCEAYIRDDEKTPPKARRRKVNVEIVEIVLYSTRQDSDRIGQALSEASIFLQEPAEAEISTEYYNPHVFTETSNHTTPFFRNAKSDDPKIEEAAFQIINAQSSEVEEDLRIDPRITTKLQR